MHSERKFGTWIEEIVLGEFYYLHDILRANGKSRKCNVPNEIL